MKLVIPRLKADKFSLIKPWAFGLHHESRNDALFTYLGLTPITDWREQQTATPEAATLPKGTLLSIERYYIRQGNEQFDSVTFMIHEINGVALKKKIRFWVKLDEACLAEFKYA
jgi:hypothetical protein